MPVLTVSQLEQHAERLADPTRMLVVTLCAEWCDTCRQFRGKLESIAQQLASATFVWIDIEDDSEIAGDIDIETFPTLAVFRNDTVVHYGASLPFEAAVLRLLEAVAERTSPVADAPAAVRELPALLGEHAGLQS